MYAPVVTKHANVSWTGAPAELQHAVQHTEQRCQLLVTLCISPVHLAQCSSHAFTSHIAINARAKHAVHHYGISSSN